MTWHLKRQIYSKRENRKKRTQQWDWCPYFGNIQFGVKQAWFDDQAEKGKRIKIRCPKCGRNLTAKLYNIEPFNCFGEWIYRVPKHKTWVLLEMEGSN